MKTYVTSVEFKSDYRCFKTGERFEFKPLNMLVGDQGCGKSSLISLLFKKKTDEDRKIIDVKLSDEVIGKGITTYFFDSEKDNPRIKEFNLYGNADGTSKGIGIGAAVAAKFCSHGQTLIHFSVNALNKAKDCVVFLDEPESGLSIRNQIKLADAIENAIDRGCQLFIATHSLVLVEYADAVLSLEHKEWMDNDDFIYEQSKDQII